jgi:hypothetical protein
MDLLDFRLYTSDYWKEPEESGIEIDITDIEYEEWEEVSKIKVPVIPISSPSQFLDIPDWHLAIKKASYRFTREWIEIVPDIHYTPQCCIFLNQDSSMYPNYKNPCKVLSTWISRSNWEFCRGVHIIATKTRMLLLRRIRLYQNGQFLLVTDNPAYGEIWLPASSIQAIWKAEYKTYELAE